MKQNSAKLSNVITLELSTNLIGLDGAFCTYWGAGQSENTLNEDMIAQDFEEKETDIHPDYYLSHFNNGLYMKEWNKHVLNFVEEKIVEAFKDNFDQDVEFIHGGYSSPREYNFSHDVSNFDLVGDFSKLIEFCKNDEDFADFLKANYTSCDGFLSYTSNNVTDWLKDIANNDMTAYGAAVRFLLGEYDRHDVSSAFEQMPMYTEFVDYTELEKFKSGDIDFDDLEEWQSALVDRDIFTSPAAYQVLNDCYRETLSVEATNSCLQTILDSEYDFTKIVKNYFEKIGESSLNMF